MKFLQLLSNAVLFKRKNESKLAYEMSNGERLLRLDRSELAPDHADREGGIGNRGQKTRGKG